MAGNRREGSGKPTRPVIDVGKQRLDQLTPIKLNILEKLRASKEFRREWFRAELEQGVPDQIRTLREERDLSQSELASAAGMKQPAISRLEKTGEANWKFDTLLRVAEALDAQLIVQFKKFEPDEEESIP